MKTITPVAVLASLALAVPAAAHDQHGPDHSTRAPKTHTCEAPKPRAVAYRVAGTLVSGALTQNPDGTYNGTLVVHVTRTNHHAKADKGTDKSYALDHARVGLHGENAAAPTAGSSVKLKGTVTTLGKKCAQTGFTPTTTIKKATIKPPKVS
jgi:hypothetical protein